MKKGRRTTEFDKKAGERLRVGRVACGLTLDELGKAVNVTGQQVQKYEKGENRLPFEKACKLAQMVGLRVDELAAVDDKSDEFGLRDKKVSDAELRELIRPYLELEGKDLRRSAVMMLKGMVETMRKAARAQNG